MADHRFPPCTPMMRWCRHGGPCCGYFELSGLADEEAEISGDAYRWIPPTLTVGAERGAEGDPSKDLQTAAEEK